MSDPAFLADGSGIAPHIPLAKVRKVGLGGETAHGTTPESKTTIATNSIRSGTTLRLVPLTQR